MICLRGTDGESMAKTDITKRALAESFKALMRKKPFNKISVESICEGAGTSRRNFYRHFLDKYELLTWVYYEDFVKEMEQKPVSRALDLFPDVCRELYRDRAFYNNAFGVSGQNSFRSFCTDHLYPYLYKDLEPVFRSEDDAHFYIDLITNAVFDRFQAWLSSEPCMSSEEFVEEITSSIRKLARRLDQVNAPVVYQDDDESPVNSKYIVTYTGKHFYITKPRKSDIDIRDIAHSLSMLCRGNGHLRQFYSVGAHCIACYHEAAARNYSRIVQAGCLLHDAAEAYLADLTRPTKVELPEFVLLEDKLNDLIWSRYFPEKLTPEDWRIITQLDNDMLAYEFSHLMPERLHGTYGKIITDPLGETADFNFQDPRIVEEEFLVIFDLLSGMKI